MCDADIACDHSVSHRPSGGGVAAIARPNGERFVGMFATSMGIVDSQTLMSEHIVPHPEGGFLRDETRYLANRVVDAVLVKRDADIIRRRFGWRGEPQTLDTI